MTTETSASVEPGKPQPEDKRLERLYDYTKFHIGIYLSSAAGVAALLGSKDAGWVISTLIGNEYLLYAAFGLMVLAGMCGGVVATSITECKTFEEFWSGREHHPAAAKIWAGKGEVWVHREHAFFWGSLLVLAASILVRWPGPPSVPNVQKAESGSCCICAPHVPASGAAK